MFLQSERTGLLQIDFGLQESELRAAILKEKESLQQTKKLLQDSKSDALQYSTERDSLQKQLDLQQKQHSEFLETFKATKSDETSSRALLTESAARHEATVARLMKEQEAERASLSSRVDKLQKQYDDALQAKRDLEQQLQERELPLRQATRERDEARVELSKAQQSLEQIKTSTVDVSVHQRLLDQLKEERSSHAARIDESSRSYKDELAGRQRQWDTFEQELKDEINELRSQVSVLLITAMIVLDTCVTLGLQAAEWKLMYEEELDHHEETVRATLNYVSVCRQMDL